MSNATNESPNSAAGPPLTFGASPSAAASHTFSGQQFLPGPGEELRSGAYSQVPRRILTPRSPSSRNSSYGRGMGVGTIDAQQTPFLPAKGRAYVAEPVPHASSEVASMPTPSGQQQQHQQQQHQHYGFPQAASAPSNAPRGTSGGTMQAPGRTPLSQSASPSISASSQNPSSGQASPASFLFRKGAQTTPQSASSYYPGSSFGTAIQAGGGLQFQGPSGVPEGPYSAPAPATKSNSLQPSSASSSRQNSTSDPIQVLTITTSEGSYTVPVDVHQASRLADEKRARNAGASARFRQRRKEKEKEASTSIEKLQQQTRDLERKMRDVEQQRDRYRHERDRLRDIVYRSPDIRHLAMQGPPSPQSMRPGPSQGAGMGMGTGTGMGQSGSPPAPPPPPAQMGYQASESTSERAPRRRKTDPQGEYTGLAYSLPPASTLPPVQEPGYPPTSGIQGPPSLPPLRMDNPSAPRTPNTNIPPSTSAGPQPPFEPYARGYERGWPGDAGRR
ncbi:uncharacterized protein L3040_004402 [Drepanopeziza brunnea f. sp. 'multigermtubi']|nr:hypothetical protein L3040_004402 [Drepanopeziza brunnea f. sp. 'multigermtubi']